MLSNKYWHKSCCFFGKGALKRTLLKKTPGWVRTMLNCSLAVDLIQSYGGNTASILGMLTDNDKLSAIIDKVITACSIGGIIATICDVCDGSLDGKCF